jgi:hypothetical protein
VEESVTLHDEGLIARNAASPCASARNFEFRSLHHHVFDTRLVVEAVTHVGLDVLAVEPLRPYHVIVVARNPAANTTRQPFPDERLRAILRNSPFATDRQTS